MDATIIITTWNRRCILEEIITTLYNQSYPRQSYQIIVCDSHSTDGTAEMIVEMASQLVDLDLRVVQAFNSISHKRNAGIRNAEGRYLIFLDDDCVPGNDFIDKHINFIKSSPLRSLCSGLIMYRDLGRFKSKSYAKYKIDRHNLTNNNSGRKNKAARSIVAMNLCVRKTDLLANEIFFNERICAYGLEDYDFAKQCLAKSFQMYIGEAFIYHEEVNATFFAFARKITELSKSAMPILLSQNSYQIKDLPFYALEINRFVNSIIELTSLRVVSYLRDSLAKIYDLMPYVPNFLARFLIVVSYIAGKKER